MGLIIYIYIILWAGAESSFRTFIVDLNELIYMIAQDGQLMFILYSS